MVIGIYPLASDDSCHFLAIDFDEEDWREDSLAFVRSCRELSVPSTLEISRSGEGAHVWIFFEGPVQAREARRLGSALISRTCAGKRQLELKSYDRLFPNQDRLPSGGFGNLIALPLQKKARERGRSVFVDDNFIPWPDQWAFLASLARMQTGAIGDIALHATEGRHCLDVAFEYEEDSEEPWKTVLPKPATISVAVPNSLETVVPSDAGIQEIFSILSRDEARNSRICYDIIESYREGRKIIVLTERSEHLETLHLSLAPEIPNIFLLHGRLSRKQRTEVGQALESLPGDESRLLLATGKLIGEGFDHAPLDTLVLAMPISWKGTLQQYAGRLNRTYSSKHDLRVYDYVERDNPRLARMWAKRERGYKAMGYRIRRMET
jgi:hypothetical protein